MRVSHLFVALILGLFVSLAAVSVGCERGKRDAREVKPPATQPVDRAAERTGEALEKAGEKTGEALDKAGEKSGEAVEKAGERSKEALD